MTARPSAPGEATDASDTAADRPVVPFGRPGEAPAQTRARLLSEALDGSNSGILVCDLQSHLLYANEGFERMFGYTEAELVGQRPSDVLTRAHSDPDQVARIRDRADALQQTQTDLLVYRKDGRPLWVSLNFNPIYAADQQPSHYVAVLTDITETKMHEVLQHRVLEALVQERPLIEVMTLICTEVERIAPDVVATVMSADHQGCLYSLAAPSLPPEYADAVNGLKIAPGVGACGTAAWRGRAVMVEDIATDPLFEQYRDLLLPMGLRACWSTPIKANSSRVLGTVALYYRRVQAADAWHVKLTDLCQQLCTLALEREQTRQRVHQLAFYDVLTGLPNRIMFSARAEQSLTLAEYAGEPAALMFINIDRFKLINDSQGHAAGDGLLRDIALRIGEQLPGTAILARLAGDEFALALPQCSAEQASAAAERLLGSIAGPLPVGTMVVHPSASIGVAMFPEDGRDITILLRHADLAMNRAKQEGGGRFRFFSLDMNRMAQERVALEAELRQAVARGQLQLHYQPQLHSQAPHGLYGVEALLRWNHPQLGAVSPARFLPVAEEQGMMPQLNDWVLRDACRQIADWRQRGVQVTRVSVNLSASSFESPRMLDELLRLIAEMGAHPSDLTLEITESVMLSGQAGVLETLHAIRAAGISLSLDDFGTGYSSLSHLHRLPIDELKLDMSFVRDIEHSDDARALTTSVLRIGENLRKHVVAEGVENEAQRRLLADLGCEVLQGYLFSRPLPAPALERWLGERH
ncbi:sensor domain-containing protein [Xanthomonas maliensis]|uniref:sensor domain-containing protein n=1 Tax=Xanthomonas maliensis TaxID=1321368 RepID=UPI0003A17DEC|nr:EAL domain-containing protein [Xanthomonas maliensis]KAB7768197.1 bifunctional diguanylate cyclase/phosphodiesterase [Xanthomonas maliensis]